MRRGALVVIVVAVVLAGCSGGGTRTPQSIEATATQAIVSDDTLAETGFTADGVERVQVNRSGTLQIAGDVQMSLGYRVNATGWRATYRDGARVFALYTVPDAKPDNVAARIDPLGDRSTAVIVDGAQDAYAVESLSHRENRTASVLGAERTVRRYAGTATANGTVEVTVSVVTVDHENDIVRAVAIAPADADAWPTVEQLFGGFRH
jgi:hypothetical protein